MKKTFFQKSYNFISNLSLIGLIGIFFYLFLKMIYQVIELYGLSQYSDKFILINEKIEMVNQLIFVISISILAITLTLLIIELSHRIVKDSLWNYFKSVYQTIRIRQFLKQDELSETITFNENQTVTRLNPILREFNQSVSKCSIDIHNDEITVFMKIPRTQQSQKLLRDMEEHIREEISSYNPNYYFSIPVRERNGLWFKGTKR
ncbi:hypothetical protein [Streptococcus salivarius]|uniref:hypothetical protein n=1 Tax=Streptococcus salivarius TaxID=1304 RepID=UPI000225109F|nr:hypothetical protein [Streptococcus salivarius]EGX29382.1 membrane protein [Streptococcus salivarius M18]MBZ5847202.1 hypothetical protein [Streptococcus salivarius]